MPPLVEDVKKAFSDYGKFVEVLGKIARGRADCGRPLAGETSRQLAREVMHECGVAWPAHERKPE